MTEDWNVHDRGRPDSRTGERDATLRPDRRLGSTPSQKVSGDDPLETKSPLDFSLHPQFLGRLPETHWTHPRIDTGEAPT